MEPNDIQFKKLHALLNENRSLPDFGGYSFAELRQIIMSPFEEGSPLQFGKLSEADYKKIPLFNQVSYLLDLVARSGELKLTTKGFLSTKVVAEIYQQGFLKDKMIDAGVSKLYKETDCNTINLTRLLAELTGLVKKRKGKLSMTQSGLKLQGNQHETLIKVFLTMALKFNWSYFDLFGDNFVGQGGYEFTLAMLSRYGNQKLPDTFYAEKYFKAFPKSLDSVAQSPYPGKRYADSCFSIRSFDRFLKYFGLVDIQQEKIDGEMIKYVQKTDLFDKFIQCLPPRMMVMLSGDNVPFA